MQSLFTTSNICSSYGFTNPWPLKLEDILPSDMPSLRTFPNWFGNATQLDEILEEEMFVCEIGSWTGSSASFMAPKVKFLIAIDPWYSSEEEYRIGTSLPESLKWGPEVKMLPYIYPQFIKTCWSWRDKILPLKMLSKQGLPLLFEKGLVPDLFYIDGEHYYESVLYDITTVLTLFPSSICCGDDITFVGVDRATKECAEKFKKELIISGNFWRMK
jgi:hypothetical protein